MANVCTFLMRVRGTKQNCMKLYLEGMRHCYEWDVDHESGSEDDYILSIFGECRWSVSASMIEDKEDDSFNGKTLCEKSQLLSLEIEVFGYDISEPEWIEHYHYKNGVCLRAFNLLPYIMEDEVDSFEEDEIDLSKYDHIESEGVYVLKEEENEPFEWDEEKEEMRVKFTMPLDVDSAAVAESDILPDEYKAQDEGIFDFGDCAEEKAYLEKLLQNYSDEQIVAAVQAMGADTANGIGRAEAAAWIVEIYLEDGGLAIMDYEDLYEGDLDAFKAFFDEEIKSIMDPETTEL